MMPISKSNGGYTSQNKRPNISRKEGSRKYEVEENTFEQLKTFYPFKQGSLKAKIQNTKNQGGLNHGIKNSE
jgi:hypothetical protein